MILNLNTQEQHNAVSMQPHFYGYLFVTDIPFMTRSPD